MVWIMVRIMAVVAVACPPTGINRELGQVGKPVPDQVGVNSGGCAAHQGSKRIKICRSLSLGHQVRIEELVMSDLIVSVVVDVLIHVFVQHRESGSVEWIAGAAWHFRVLDAAKFVVLDPKIRLEYFQRRWEP